ncbi:nucleotidyltransferase family protein [Phaeobacter porticola]|uniref:Putative MobA-related protein n=1 Tax=Phaeobacter porticola TaxID=1844006 RepID=A0A1L3I3Y1_9RHOB|nr:nucleotidyltransferase family protein [Phaeobacter porticola]APG46821.1 putative MobA-related protein [Phaeobacter porticola]
MINIAILILAAGAARRMRGRDKLLEHIDASPLLSRICAAALATGHDTYVTLPAASHPRATLILNNMRSATAVYVPDAAEGMGASIRTGVAAVGPDYDGVMILPADMPELTQEDLRQVISGFAAAPDMILRATAADGRFGHPVIFPRRHFTALAQLQGDKGARALVKSAIQNSEKIATVALPDQHALTDLDTPEAWANWRAQRHAPTGS